MNTAQKIAVVRAAVEAIRGTELSWQRRLLVASETARALGLHAWRCANDTAVEITRNNRSFKVLEVVNF